MAPVKARRRGGLRLAYAAALCAAAVAWAHEHGSASPAKPRPALATSAAFAPDGSLWVVWVRDGYVVLQHADDARATLSEPVRVTERAEAIAAEGENRPKIAFGRRGEIFLTYTHPLPQPYAGDIRFLSSSDGGRHFSAPLTINDNREPITHRFDSLVVDDTGGVYVAWIDKRDVPAGKARSSYAGAAIYAAVSADGGATFSPNFKVADHSCECCRLGVAPASAGGVWLLWRHVFAGSERDHALARLDGARVAQAAQRVTFDHWRIEACPHHGPALAQDDAGTRHVAWFNERDGESGLFYARLAADGAPQDVSRFGGLQASHPSLLAQGRRLWRAWSAFDGRETAVWTQHSADGGTTWSAPARRAATPGAADYAQLITDGKRAFLSWRTQAEGYRLLPLE